MGCARLMDREDTKPVTKYKSPRGTKANDKQKETWPYFLEWKGLQTGTTTLVFLQHDVDAFLFGIQSSQQMQTWLPHPVSFFSLPILYHFNPCVICDLHWSGYRLSNRLTPRLPSTAGLTHISMQNSNLLLPEMGSRAPSLQPFHRGKCYGLKHKHSQVPCQFSHRHPALLTGYLKPNSASTKLTWLHYKTED